MTASRPKDPTRDLLTTVPAPLSPLAVVSSFTAKLGDGLALKLQYVPDRVLLKREGLEAYVAARSATPMTSLEALTSLIADDVANELVPKWSRVTVTQTGAVTHSVVAEDRQPGWNHPTLLNAV